MTTYTPPPEPARTASRRSRPGPLVIGILLALVGFPLLLGGLGLGWAMATQRDDDGFFSTPTEQLTTETVALSSEVVNFGEAGPDDWWADRDLATVRLSARSADASAVFIGIAPSADVARYLGSASYDEISDLRTDPFAYSLTRRGTGGDLSAAPTDQGFWTAQSSGPGTQALTWDLEPGTYTGIEAVSNGLQIMREPRVATGKRTMVYMAVSLALTAGGILVGYLSSRETAPRIGRQSGGAMRADGWNRIPLIRMTNINLLPKPGMSLDEIVQDTDDGLYLRSNRSWSIDDRRLNFQFATEVAYEIKGGKLGRLYKNPTYTGITYEFWRSCDAVGDERSYVMLGTPNCGKGEPGQTGHVGHAVPGARFRNVQVGVGKW